MMDQDAWNQVYNDLDADIAAMAKRGGQPMGLAIYQRIDDARFAIARGDNARAIAILDDVRKALRAGDGAATRGAASMPTLDRLDALEDLLHGEKRFGSARLEIVGEEEDEETTSRSASQNARVNKSIKYEDIAAELEGLFKSARLREEKLAAVHAETNRVIANRAIYQEIENETKVPWWFTGLIHGMECSFSLNKHLHNGDSLKARTWQVPAGRPKIGSPPFAFSDSACDALECDGFAGKTDWHLSMVLYRLERYNGFGYRKKFGSASPYLWSYTNHFTSGKYVRDGVYDPDATSKQCGAAAMLRDLIDRGVVSFEAKPAVTAPAPSPVAVAPPVPVATPVPVTPTTPPTAVSQPAPIEPPKPVVAVAPAVVPGAVVPVTPAPSAPAPVPAAPVPAVATPAAAPAPTAPAPAPVVPQIPASPTLSPAVASALSALAAAATPAAAAAVGVQPAAAEKLAGAAVDATRGLQK